MHYLIILFSTVLRCVTLHVLRSLLHPHICINLTLNFNLSSSKTTYLQAIKKYFPIILQGNNCLDSDSKSKRLGFGEDDIKIQGMIL